MEPLAAPAPRLAPLYTFGVPVVVVVDGLLALLLGTARAGLAHNEGMAERLGYTVGYAGCSLAFCALMIFGGTFLLTRVLGPRRGLLLKTVFWSGVSWVPLLFLALAISAAARHAS